MKLLPGHNSKSVLATIWKSKYLGKALFKLALLQFILNLFGGICVGSPLQILLAVIYLGQYDFLRTRMGLSTRQFTIISPFRQLKTDTYYSRITLCRSHLHFQRITCPYL